MNTYRGWVMARVALWPARKAEPRSGVELRRRQSVRNLSMMIPFAVLLELQGPTKTAGDPPTTLVSPSARYTVTPVTAKRGTPDETIHLIVKRRADQVVIATIDPNPGGAVRSWNYDLRFVGGDNILVSWGCGTYCQVAPVFTPTGRQLVSLGIHSVSPNGRCAVSYEPFDSPSVSNVVISDLASGKTLAQQTSRNAWNTCSVVWAKGRIHLEPCSNKTQAVTVSVTARCAG